MLPVGRLTMVRAFPKSELIRAMSFVAIPGLIGPMLGPVAGGFIIGYFHWSVIFFVNIPIGIAGLWMVYRHLPNFRDERNVPVDFVGLVLFGSGIALLSYVLEVFGNHTLSVREIAGLLGISAALLIAYGINSARTLHPLLRLGLFQDSHVPLLGERQLLHAPRHRRHAVPVAAALSGRLRIHADPIGAADHAAGGRGDEPQAHDAAATAQHSATAAC